jgi:glyoxylase I family protein
MNALTFAHVAMGCKEPIVTERFYNKYFGFKRARVIPLDGEQIVFIKSGNVYLELFQAKEEAPVPPAGGDGPQYPGLRHLAFKVDDVDDKLAEMGNDANITLGPLSFDDFIPGWRTVWVADPEGNIIEISQGYTDEENPPPLPE